VGWGQIRFAHFRISWDDQTAEAGRGDALRATQNAAEGLRAAERALRPADGWSFLGMTTQLRVSHQAPVASRSTQGAVPRGSPQCSVLLACHPEEPNATKDLIWVTGAQPRGSHARSLAVARDDNGRRSTPWFHLGQIQFTITGMLRPRHNDVTRLYPQSLLRPSASAFCSIDDAWARRPKSCQPSAQDPENFSPRSE